MQLTKFQINKLKQYQKYRREAPTLPGLLKAVAPLLFLLCLGAGFGYWAATYDGLPRLGWCFIGFILGALFYSITSASTTVHMWPVVHEVFDWDRIDELVKTNEDRAA